MYHLFGRKVANFHHQRYKSSSQYISLFDSGEYDRYEQQREGQVQQEVVNVRLRAVHFRVELGHAFYLHNEFEVEPDKSPK